MLNRYFRLMTHSSYEDIADKYHKAPMTSSASEARVTPETQQLLDILSADVTEREATTERLCEIGAFVKQPEIKSYLESQPRYKVQLADITE